MLIIRSLLKNTKVGVVSLSCLLAGCTMLDDYMLGKDNQPAPIPLKKIEPKVAFKQQWMESVSPRSKQPTELYKLKPALFGNAVYTASATGFVQARDQQSGRLIWSKDVKIGVASGPMVNEKMVVVGSNEARVVALDRGTGRLLWQTPVSNQLLAPPIITNGKVLAKTIDGQLYAFNAYTGKRLWRYTHGAPNLILRASSAPVVSDSLVISGFADGKVDAVDLNSGRLEWQRNITYASGSSEVERLIDIDATPVVRGGQVYVVSYQGEVSALSLKDGHVMWQRKMSAYRDMAVTVNAIYVVDAKSQVWALSRQNGMVLWSQKSLINRMLNAPTISRFGIILSDRFGFVHVLSKLTGEEIARDAVSSQAFDSAPVVKGSSIYLLQDNGVLTKLNMTARAIQ